MMLYEAEIPTDVFMLHTSVLSTCIQKHLAAGEDGVQIP